VQDVLLNLIFLQTTVIEDIKK